MKRTFVLDPTTPFDVVYHEPDKRVVVEHFDYHRVRAIRLDSRGEELIASDFRGVYVTRQTTNTSGWVVAASTHRMIPVHTRVQGILVDGHSIPARCAARPPGSQ